MTRRTLDGASKWALRDFLRDEWIAGFKKKGQKKEEKSSIYHPLPLSRLSRQREIKKYVKCPHSTFLATIFIDK
jgi:hypothetical protein